MRIAILEWVSGGGMAREAAANIPGGLLTEGLAMLECLATGLQRGGHDVLAAVDARLVPADTQRRLAKAAQLTPVFPAEDSASPPSAWLQLGEACDVALVIAPECDHLLAGVLEALRAGDVDLVNCTGDFLLSASDKLVAAGRFGERSVAHPPTCCLSRLDEEWMLASRLTPERADPARWVVKPTDGAGCEGLQLVSEPELRSRAVAGSSSDEFPSSPASAVVQPWLDGQPLSCSAIVDRAGHRHWMPLVTQEFSGGPKPKYRGGRIADREMQCQRPTELLDNALDALGDGVLGWVGIDLIYSPTAGSWHVIEVNPRCTTSVLGLSRSYTGNLACELVGAYQGTLTGLSQEWRQAEFRV